MKDVLIVVLPAIITALASIICQISLGRSNQRSMMESVDRRSDMADQKLQARIDQYAAVTDTKLDELTREVRTHNEFAARIPLIDQRVTVLEQRVGKLEDKHTQTK